MREVAPQCSKIVQDLISILEKLKSTGGKRDALKKAVRNIWQKSEIEGLFEKLQNHQKLVESLTVFTIRDKIDLLAAMDKDRFDQIDDRLKDLLSRFDVTFSKLHTDIQDIVRQLESKLDQTAIKIDQVVAHRLDERLEREKFAQAKEQLLVSLDFAERNLRIMEIA